MFEKDIPAPRKYTWRRGLYEQIRLRMEQTKPPAALRIDLSDMQANGIRRMALKLRQWFDEEMPGRIMVQASTSERAVYVRYAPGSKGR